MNETQLIEEARQVTFDWHIVRVMNWLRLDRGRLLDNILVYAAVDLRCAIERYMFEFLLILKDGKLNEEEKTRCRSIDGLFTLMREADASYRKTARFSIIYSEVFPGVPELTLVDFGYLHKAWMELSQYCHKQLMPKQTFLSPRREFQRRGFDLISSVLARFSEWKLESTSGILRPESMKPEIKAVYDKYVRHEINDDQVRRMLTILEPVLNTRPPWMH